MQRAFSTLDIKSAEDDSGIIEGFASTPELDRGGDIMEPGGAKFLLPMPLLWGHKHDRPIGQVFQATVTPQGIKIKARIERGVLPFIDEAWTLIKSGLMRGLSIGWRALEPPVVSPKGTFQYKSWEWLETSTVVVPMNAGTLITAVKSIATEELATKRDSASLTRPTLRTSTTVVTTTRAGSMKKTYAEQITGLEATRQQKAARLDEIQSKAVDEGRAKETEEKQEFDELKVAIKSIDEEIADLRELEHLNRTSAVAVKAATPEEAAVSRGLETRPNRPVITVRPNQPPGIGFARMAMVKAVAHMDHRYVNDVAKEMFPHDDRLHAFLQHKATVLAGTTTNAVWASALVDTTNIMSEFIEFLTPMTIIGKLGTDGIPGPTRVPFNVRVPRQTALGEAYWVGEGAPKPVGADEFDAITLLPAKVATIRVITQELARFSQPNAETLVRDGLARAIARRLDIDFVDPAQAAVANVNPASITNGLTALSSAGTSADNARTDIGNLLESFITANVDPTSLVLIMPNTLALSLSLMVNSLGQPEFPGLTMRGGTLLGIPVIASQYVANASGAGNMVIALNAADLLLADDGRVDIDISTEASLQMLDNPTNNSATGTATQLVSLWQTNSIGLRGERFINWVKARSTAVAYMDDVNWGAIGSPA